MSETATPSAPQRHIMLDIETLGRTAGSAIVGIGAVAFDNSGILNTFGCRIDLRSCQRAGLHIDADTVMWWLRQGEEPRREIYDAREGLAESLDKLTAWLAEWSNKEALIWGNGSDFDNVILAAAYEAIDRRVPWRYSKNRCFRTIKAMFGDRAPEPARDGVHHHPVFDAIHQAKHLLVIMALGDFPALK